MKKILLAGIVCGVLACVLSITAVLTASGNMFNLTNFNNYKVESKSLNNAVSITLIDCEVIEIEESLSNELYIEYYSNDNSQYFITGDTNVIIEGVIEDEFFDLNKKGVEIYIPRNSNIDIIINTEDAKIDIEDVTLNDLDITCNDSVVEISDVICNNFVIKAEDSKLELDDIKSPIINLSLEDSTLELDLPLRKSEYTLELSLIDTSCNVVSSGTGANKVVINSNEGKVRVYFED